MLEYRNVAVDLSTMSLRHTLCNPDDVAVFLLFQFHKSVENAKMKLVHKCFRHQFHLQPFHQLSNDGMHVS